MKRRGRDNQRAAFTLTEVLLAMILFAVAATGLLTLFPVAHITERENIQEAKATLIASGIMESLNIADNMGSRKFPSGTSHGSILWEHVDPAVSSSHSLLYNSTCNPIRLISAEEAASGISEADATAVVTVVLAPMESMPRITTAEVIVASPASAPASKRALQRYVMLLSVP